MKVLIVDDNEVTRDLERTLLQEMGNQVVGESDNGTKAAGLFAGLGPELVLLDMVMPGKSGLEVLKEIRALDAGARVVMVTAVQQDVITSQLLAAGAAAVLNKPFSYEELEEVLKKFC